MQDQIDIIRADLEALKGRVSAIEKAIAWVTGGAAGMAALAMAIKSGFLKWLAGAG